MRVRLPTACGGTILVPVTFGDHQAAHPVDMDDLREAVSRITLPGARKLVASVDLGRIVGFQHQVDAGQVGPRASILAARRLGRLVPSRVVTGIEPESTTVLTVVALPVGKGRHRLTTAFHGFPIPIPPPDPSHAFRTNEAFVWMEGRFEEPPFRTSPGRLADGRWIKDAGVRPSA